MTYCVGIKASNGIVFASDSRTNAGLDNVNIYSKMFIHDVGDRTIIIVTSGNLGTSQAVYNSIRKDLDSTSGIMNLNTCSDFEQIASYIGSLNIEHSSPKGINTDTVLLGSTFIVGGQIRGKPLELYLVYPQGNYIKPADSKPYLVIGEVNGKIRLVAKGSPNSYPQAFEVDHRRAIQELRTLGIPAGVGANFSDNLEIIYSVFNRAKNNLGNPSLPAEFSAALGLSTTLKDMVGKYFKSNLTLKGLDIPEAFKEQALFRMLDDLQNEISGLGPDGTVTAFQVKKWSEAIAAREVQFWKSLGSPLTKALEAAKETAPADIQKQIDTDRWAGNVSPDMRFEELKRMGIFDYLKPKTIRRYKKAADKFIGTKRGLRASMSKQRFEQEGYGLD